jgi:hypothetical protein
MPSRHHGFHLVSIAVRIEALLLHGEVRPMTALPARATSATTRKIREGMRWDEANRSLWPNSEFHEESLPAMPVLVLLRVQTNPNTTVQQSAMKICATSADT